MDHYLATRMYLIALHYILIRRQAKRILLGRQHPSKLGHRWVSLRHTSRPLASGNHVAFSRDNNLVVSCSKDKILRVWDLEAKPVRDILEIMQWFVSWSSLIEAVILRLTVEGWTLVVFPQICLLFPHIVRFQSLSRIIGWGERWKTSFGVLPTFMQPGWLSGMRQ